MARQNRDTAPEASSQALEATLQMDPIAGTRPEQPRPPQGIAFRFLSTGEERKDKHPKWKHVRMLDPVSLMRDDGTDPFIALPIDGDPANVRIRQVLAKDAARLLSCDPATGGVSIYRLATDAEVEQNRREHAERAANKGQPKK
jgi:hypothetical protein